MFGNTNIPHFLKIHKYSSCFQFCFSVTCTVSVLYGLCWEGEAWDKRLWMGNVEITLFMVPE